MTSQSQKEQPSRITTNPNPAYKSLSDLEQANANLEEARVQINNLIDERNNMSGTVNRLDRDVARHQDKIGELEQQRDSIVSQFQDLYNKHEGLMEVVAQNIFASSLSTGRLAEAITRFKFTLPETSQK